MPVQISSLDVGVSLDDRVGDAAESAFANKRNSIVDVDIVLARQRKSASLFDLLIRVHVRRGVRYPIPNPLKSSINWRAAH
jgi:hypothetical protein